MHESYNASLINENENIINNFYQLLYENNNSWFEIKTLLDLSDEIVHENNIVINESFSIKEIAKKIIEKIKNFFKKLKELFLSAINAIKKKFKSQEVKKDCQEIRKAVETQRNSGSATKSKSSSATKLTGSNRLALPGVLDGKIRVNISFLNLVRNNGDSFVMWFYENIKKLMNLENIFNSTYAYYNYLKKSDTPYEEYEQLTTLYFDKQRQKYADGYNKVLKLLCEKFKGLDKYIEVSNNKATTSANNNFFIGLKEYTKDQLENDQYKEDVDVLDVLDLIENTDKILSPLEKDIRNIYKIQNDYEDIVDGVMDNVRDIIDNEEAAKMCMSKIYNFFSIKASVQFNLITGFSESIIWSYNKIMMELHAEAKKYKIR